MASKFRLDDSPYAEDSSKYLDADEYDHRIAETFQKPSKTSFHNEISTPLFLDYDDMADLGEGHLPTDERYGSDRISRIVSDMSPGHQLVAAGMNKAEELVGETAFSYVEASLRTVGRAVSKLWELGNHIPVRVRVDMLPPANTMLVEKPTGSQYKKFEGKCNMPKTAKVESRSKKRIPLTGSGGLIEVSESDGNGSWFGESSDDEGARLRDVGYVNIEQVGLGGRMRIKKLRCSNAGENEAKVKSIAVQTSIDKHCPPAITERSHRTDLAERPYRVSEKKAGRQKDVDPSSGSSEPYRIDRGYRPLEAYDSDFDVEGGVEWPLSDELMAKHMEKMALKNEKHSKTSSKVNDPHRRRAKEQVEVGGAQAGFGKKQVDVRKEQAQVEKERHAMSKPLPSYKHVNFSQEMEKIRHERAERAKAIYQERKKRERDEKRASEERERRMRAEEEERVNAELEAWPPVLHGIITEGLTIGSGKLEESVQTKKDRAGLVTHQRRRKQGSEKLWHTAQSNARGRSKPKMGDESMSTQLGRLKQEEKLRMTKIRDEAKKGGSEVILSKQEQPTSS